MTLTRNWETRIERGELVDDPAQRSVVARLQALQDRIHERRRPLARLLRSFPMRPSAEDMRGLYLWGGVGRGKTFLMDLFYETLHVHAKRRLHFHRMMSDVHRRLKALRDVEDPLDSVSEEIAAEARVLCFDEFFVSDIADAMILARLLEGLFARGVVLLATSNTPPSELYRDGLQRERFLPAISMLENNTDVVALDGSTDYRLRLLQSAGTYLCPADEHAHLRLKRYFRDIAAGASEREAEFQVAGRPIRSLRRAPGIAWFAFAALCDSPRSADDYIEIARSYPTVILSDVPVLGGDDENAARRFISLVDEFYDRRVKLLMSARAPIDKLYTGRKLAFEFRRTASRLSEMQSTEYLHAAHLA